MEKLYEKINGAGIMSMVLGIVLICTSIATGVLMIVNGAKLIKSKKDITF